VLGRVKNPSRKERTEKRNAKEGRPRTWTYQGRTLLNLRESKVNGQRWLEGELAERAAVPSEEEGEEHDRGKFRDLPDRVCL